MSGRLVGVTLHAMKRLINGWHLEVRGLCRSRGHKLSLRAARDIQVLVALCVRTRPRPHGGEIQQRW